MTPRPWLLAPTGAMPLTFDGVTVYAGRPFVAIETHWEVSSSRRGRAVSLVDIDDRLTRLHALDRAARHGVFEALAHALPGGTP